MHFHWPCRIGKMGDGSQCNTSAARTSIVHKIVTTMLPKLKRPFSISYSQRSTSPQAFTYSIHILAIERRDICSPRASSQPVSETENLPDEKKAST